MGFGEYYFGGIITDKDYVIKETISWAKYIISALLIALFIVNFVGRIAVVVGPSMEDTLQNGDRLVTEKLTQRFGKFKPGDIVTIYAPEFIHKEGNTIIKRVIAVEGDTVEIKDGNVFVNGKLLNEPYLKEGAITRVDNVENSKLTVPKGQIFVMGDNRLNSSDSRIHGPFKVENVTGKAIFRIFPFSRIGKP